MAGDDVFRYYPLLGPVKELADAIRAGTGGPDLKPDAPSLRSALRAAFPNLSEEASLEGCTTHPALTARIRAPKSAREAVKVVFLPRPEALEARVRLEMPGGSFKRETIEGLLAFLREIEDALDRPAGLDHPPARSETAP